MLHGSTNKICLCLLLLTLYHFTIVFAASGFYMLEYQLVHTATSLLQMLYCLSMICSYLWAVWMLQTVLPPTCFDSSDKEYYCVDVIGLL